MNVQGYFSTLPKGNWSGKKEIVRSRSSDDFSYTPRLAYRCLSCKAATLHRRGRECFGPGDPLQPGPEVSDQPTNLLLPLYNPLKQIPLHLPSQLLHFYAQFNSLIPSPS